MTGKVVDLSEFRRANTPDGGANLACPDCGSEWWKSPGIVVDADSGSVNGYAHPLTCTECGRQMRTPGGVS